MYTFRLSTVVLGVLTQAMLLHFLLSCTMLPNAGRSRQPLMQALTPFTIGRSHVAASLLGALWGFGHSTGQLIMGLVMIILKVSKIPECAFVCMPIIVRYCLACFWQYCMACSWHAYHNKIKHSMHKVAGSLAKLRATHSPILCAQASSSN